MFGLLSAGADDVLQLFLDLLERLALRLDGVHVRVKRTGEIDDGEKQEHDIEPVVIGHEQENLIGDKRAERQRDRSDGRAVRPDVNRKHLAEVHHRYEPHAGREQAGKRQVAKVR